MRSLNTVEQKSNFLKVLQQNSQIDECTKYNCNTNSYCSLLTTKWKLNLLDFKFVFKFKCLTFWTTAVSRAREPHDEVLCRGIQLMLGRRSNVIGGERCRIRRRKTAKRIAIEAANPPRNVSNPAKTCKLQVVAHKDTLWETVRQATFLSVKEPQNEKLWRKIHDQRHNFEE